MQLQLPEHFLSANLFACEKVLLEKDGVASIIRVFDAIHFAVPVGLSPEQGKVDMNLFAQIKTDPEYSAEHSVQLYLVRPNGDRVSAGDPRKVVISTSVPGAAGGFTVTATIGVVTSQIGVHHFVLAVEGNDIARTAFTMVLQRPESTGEEKQR